MAAPAVAVKYDTLFFVVMAFISGMLAWTFVFAVKPAENPIIVVERHENTVELLETRTVATQSQVTYRRCLSQPRFLPLGEDSQGV